MQLKSFIPSVPEIGKEALIVIGGAIVAAVIMGYIPALQDWIKAQWAGTPHPLS